MTLKKHNVPHHIEIRKSNQTHVEEKHAMENASLHNRSPLYLTWSYVETFSLHQLTQRLLTSQKMNGKSTLHSLLPQLRNYLKIEDTKRVKTGTWAGQTTTVSSGYEESSEIVNSAAAIAHTRPASDQTSKHFNMESGGAQGSHPLVVMYWQVMAGSGEQVFTEGWGLW